MSKKGESINIPTMVYGPIIEKNLEKSSLNQIPSIPSLSHESLSPPIGNLVSRRQLVREPSISEIFWLDPRNLTTFINVSPSPSQDQRMVSREELELRLKNYQSKVTTDRNPYLATSHSGTDLQVAREGISNSIPESKVKTLLSSLKLQFQSNPKGSLLSDINYNA